MSANMVVFPNDIWWRIGSLSSANSLARLSQTCTLLYNECLRMMEQFAEREQQLMGIPCRSPFSFQQVRLSVHHVLREWRGRSSQECSAIELNLTNHPLIFYVNLYPFRVALGPLSLSGWFSASFRGSYLPTLVLANFLSWERALEIVSQSQEKGYWKSLAFVNIATIKKPIPWRKAIDIVSCVKEVTLDMRQAALRTLWGWIENDLPLNDIFVIIRNMPNEPETSLHVISRIRNIPLEELKEMYEKNLSE